MIINGVPTYRGPLCLNCRFIYVCGDPVTGYSCPDYEPLSSYDKGSSKPVQPKKEISYTYDDYYDCGFD